MRILYITAETPWPLTSGYLRHYQLLRILGQRHAITLLSLSRSSVSAEGLAALRPFTEQVLVFPTSSGNDSMPRKSHMRWLGARYERALRRSQAVLRMKSTLEELSRCESYDVVIFSGKDTFPAIADLQDIPIVVDFCDASSIRILGEMRHASAGKLFGLLLRYVKIRRIESKLLKKTPHLAFASIRDRQAVLRPMHSADIVPQAVDTEYWKRRSPVSPAAHLIFTGVMSYPPNHDAALNLVNHILPAVRQSLPGVHLFIVGRDPRLALLQAARHQSNITVTGFVEDVRPYMEGASLFVAPIRFASGVQNKILEALAMEVPVITTRVVADGLVTEDGGNPPVRIARDPGDFVRQICGLMSDHEERRSLAAQGRRYVESNFCWARSAEKLESICLAAAGPARKAAEVA